MKFKISSSALLKQLQGIGGIISTGNTLPILDCFLFQINKKDLTISASDLETTLSVKMEVQSVDNGEIAIPARILLDTLKSFPEQSLTFNIDVKLNSVEISSINGKYKLVGHPARDFPKLPEMESPSTFEIQASVLSTAINKALFATGNDDLRPAMCGIYFQLNKEGLTCVATDAHKLVKYARTDIKSTSEASYIIPKKPLSILKNLISEGTAKVQYNNINVSFNFENLHLVSRLIDSKYPNYDAVIPKENPNKLSISRELFLGSLRRVSVYSNKNTAMVKLSLTKKEMAISAEDKDSSNEANEKMKCDYQGQPMEIGFNSKFLMEMLSNLECEEIIMELGDPNKAGVMKGENDELLMLLMPIMINN